MIQSNFVGMADHHFMQRCLDLAKLGAGAVSHNPMVGAVLVADDRVIGEGYHRKFGGPHAEAEAFNSVPEADRSLIPSSTLYVNLEPCCTTGKTPPCTDLILSQGIRNVVVAMADPNPAVNGKGISQLTQAGVEVVIGTMEDEARWLNRRFVTFHEKQRPYVILKWAQSADGFMGRRGERIKISGALADRLVHKWRSEEDSVLVGTETARIDNPRLTVRHWSGRNPLRVVIDRSHALQSGLHIFDATAETLILDETEDASSMLRQLHEQQVMSVMVEGGRNVLHSFIEANLWDEARVIIGGTSLQSGIEAPLIHRAPTSSMGIGTDRILLFVNV